MYAIRSYYDAYFIPDCTIYFYISNVDKYAIKGKNLIIGSTEIIINRLLGIETKRLETVVSPCSQNIKALSTDKFINGLDTYSFIINTSTVLAQQVLQTNKILKSIFKNLHENEKLIQELSVKYYRIIDRNNFV